MFKLKSPQVLAGADFVSQLKIFWHLS